MSTVLFEKLNEAQTIALLNAPMSDVTLAYTRELTRRSLVVPEDLGYTPEEAAVLRKANATISAKLTTGNLNANKTQWMHRALAQ
jgi:hypothetical protein